MCGVHLWGSSAEAAGGPGSSARCNLETVLVRPCCHSKTPRLRGLHNRQASAHSSGVRRSKFNWPAGPESDESSLSGSQAPAVSPCASLKDRREEPLLIRALIPSGAAHPPNLIYPTYLQVPHFQGQAPYLPPNTSFSSTKHMSWLQHIQILREHSVSCVR